MEVVAVAAALAIIHQNHDVGVGRRPAPGPQRAAALLIIPAPLLRESPRDGPAFVRELERAAALALRPLPSLDKFNGAFQDFELLPRGTRCRRRADLL